jgi:predicted nucleic acid-binding protein
MVGAVSAFVLGRAILAAAKELACEAIYTEDLSDEQVCDGVRIINPFLH